MESPRVLLADDLPEMLGTVTQLLRDDFEIVGYAQDGEDPIKAATTYNPEGSDLDTSSVRVLVVEDSEPFRRFLCSTLGKRPADRRRGLRRARSGSQSPRTTTGLDTPRHRTSNTEWNRSCSTARRIRKVAPHSKILFVTQESSSDVAQEALGLGALGYVVKTHAGRELGCYGNCASGQAVCQCRIGRSRSRRTWRQSRQQTSPL
jgi:DNA-binding NarL/FixJ family response regulator